jgi:hypothetical protein
MNVLSRRFIACGGLYVASLAFLPIHLFSADVRGWDFKQKEQFLKTAKITKTYAAPKGVTGTVRVTLSDGETTHDASVQTINEQKTLFQPDNGPSEVNFRDTYKYNIAAWKLAGLLGIADMMPPYVDRKYMSNDAAYSWWVDDVMMDEGDRKSKKLTAPDTESWNREFNTMVVFDQLIFNTDRNVGNIIIDKGWHIWMIDHTRAFRMQKTLQAPKVLSFCDRNLLARMKALDQPTLRKELEPYVTSLEIQGLLARRDLIVKFFEKKGESFLFDRPARN